MAQLLIQAQVIAAYLRKLPRRRGFVSASGLALLAAVLLSACARPYVHPSPGSHSAPRLTATHAFMDDGYRLPLRVWEAEGDTRAVVLALHGLNDYSHAFDSLGQFLAPRGITIVAYDQRGFGKTAGRGLWHGSARLGGDLVTLTGLLRERYAGIPLYLLGESMGGAVVLTSLAVPELDVDGTILVAPAVWARDTMPFYQRFGLWLAAHTLPGTELTGDGLDLQPSDNIEMLRAFSRDDLVIKATRVDVLYGVSNLMDTAMQAAVQAQGNILFLYGRHDDIIPAPPTCLLYEKLGSSASVRLAAIVYENGYHMLTRDLQAAVVLQDIASWIEGIEPAAGPAGGMQGYCAEVRRG